MSGQRAYTNLRTCDAVREVPNRIRRSSARERHFLMSSDHLSPSVAPEVERLIALLKDIERHCPCGARPESPRTHPHVGGCPVADALKVAALLAQARPAEAAPPVLARSEAGESIINELLAALRGVLRVADRRTAAFDAARAAIARAEPMGDAAAMVAMCSCGHAVAEHGESAKRCLRRGCGCRRSRQSFNSQESVSPPALAPEIQQLVEDGLRVVRGFINEDLNGVICSDAAESRRPCNRCEKLWRRAYAFELSAKALLAKAESRPMPRTNEAILREQIQILREIRAPQELIAVAERVLADEVAKAESPTPDKD